MKRSIATILMCSLVLGCSTTGGIYKAGDSENGEFSAGRTVLTILGVAAAVAVGRSGGRGGGGGYADEGHAWDWQPGNGQWACRNRGNGQYAYEHQCAGVVKVDYWP